MASKSLQYWRNQARSALDEIQDAHAAVGGNQRGRRYATLQINHAYLVLVSSHFQRFCRDLHTEATDYLCKQSVPIDPRRDVLRLNLTFGRQLDNKNPQPSAIGSDFNRFNLHFWDAVKHRAAGQNNRRQELLSEMNTWRNAIAHNDFGTPGLDPTKLTLTKVKSFRKACDKLAGRFDSVVADHLATMIGVAP